MGLLRKLKRFMKKLNGPEPRMFWFRDENHLSAFVIACRENRDLVKAIKVYDRNDRETEDISVDGLMSFIGDHTVMIEIIPKEGIFTDDEETRYDDFLAELSDMGIEICGGMFDQCMTISGDPSPDDYYISENGQKIYIDLSKNGAVEIVSREV